jgi:hypothetical protein
MTSPRITQQLADTIETVVASYLDEVHRTVQRCSRTFVVEGALALSKGPF